MRLAAGLALSLILAGCRADVAGLWAGSVGDEEGTVVLDQEGALLTGTLCIGGVCDAVDGSLVEEQVTLSAGCARCALEPTDLDLELRSDRLVGTAFFGDQGPFGVRLQRR